MTIGIGVLCSTQPRPHTPRPDAIVMLSDTMGSTDTDSTDELHKMFCAPSERLYAVCADQMDIAAESFGCIQTELRKIQGPRVHGSIWRAISTAAHGHRSEHFAYDVVNPKYAVTPNKVPPEKLDDILKDWRKYDVGCQLLVGTFDEEGKALLYFVGQYEGVSALVHAVAFPGYETIGTGGTNAD